MRGHRLTRRNLLQGAMSLLSLPLLSSCAPFRGNSHDSLDKYGGWKKKKFIATGYFRVENDGARWWFVTPRGNAFISFGINHYHMEWWAQTYNRHIWNKKFNARKTFDAKWLSSFRESVIYDLSRLGLNTLGIHTTAPPLTDPPGNSPFPYVAPYEPLLLSHYKNPKAYVYADVFSPEFILTCRNKARNEVRPRSEDPMVLGFAMSDCPPLTDSEADHYGTTTWPRKLRNLPKNAPGKIAYVTTIKQIYPHIQQFNYVYGTQFTDFNSLLLAQNWRADHPPANDAEARDNSLFLKKCVRQYYSVAKSALREYDKNHLFFGDKLNGNSDALDQYLQVVAKYSEVINIQYYAPWQQQKELLTKWLPIVKLPILNGDSSYSSPTELTPSPHGRPHARDQLQRADWTKKFMENALKIPNFVGWHMCGIIDTSKEMPGKENAQHQGLMSVDGVFYAEMEKVITNLASRLYELASENSSNRET